MQTFKSFVIAVVLIVIFSCLVFPSEAKGEVETAEDDRIYSGNLNEGEYDIYKIRHLEGTYIKILIEATSEDSGVFIKIADEENYTKDNTEWVEEDYSSGNKVEDNYYTDDNIYVNISYQNSTLGIASYSFKFSYVSLPGEGELTSTMLGVAIGIISLTGILILVWLWIYFKSNSKKNEKNEERE